MSESTIKFSCTENTENGGTHLWINNEYGEPSVHILGPWEDGIRNEFVVCLNKKQVNEFKKQVAKL